MTRGEALQAVRECFVRHCYLTAGAAQAITVRRVRKWPILGRVVAWRSSKIKMGNNLVWIMVDDKTGGCTIEKVLREKLF